MELSITHLNPKGMHKNPAFTQAVIVEGNARTIYIGGQNAVSADGQVVGIGDLKAQVVQIFDNLEVILAASGAKLQDVIKWTIYAVQGQDTRPALDVFRERWGDNPNPPAITVIFVAGLAAPPYLVELEAIAVVASGDSKNV